MTSPDTTEALRLAEWHEGFAKDKHGYSQPEVSRTGPLIRNLVAENERLRGELESAEERCDQRVDDALYEQAAGDDL
jgi:hypothetical protein